MARFPDPEPLGEIVETGERFALYTNVLFYLSDFLLKLHHLRYFMIPTMPSQRFGKITSQAFFVTICINYAASCIYSGVFAINDNVNLAPGEGAPGIRSVTLMVQPCV